MKEIVKFYDCEFYTTKHKAHSLQKNIDTLITATSLLGYQIKCVHEIHSYLSDCEYYQMILENNYYFIRIRFFFDKKEKLLKIVDAMVWDNDKIKLISNAETKFSQPIIKVLDFLEMG